MSHKENDKYNEALKEAEFELTPKVAKYLSYSEKRTGGNVSEAKALIDKTGTTAIILKVLDNGRLIIAYRDGEQISIPSEDYSDWKILDENLEDIPMEFLQEMK